MKDIFDTKSELLDQKKKNHLPAVNLKFLTQTPNLTWNFQTHNKVGDNFYFVYKYLDIYIIYISTKYEENSRKLLLSVRPVSPITTRPFGPRRKFWAAGPRRDIVGILVLLQAFFCEKMPIFYFFVLRILLRILLMIL